MTKTQTVGILAYGSLIGDPGSEIEEVRTGTIDDVVTPFPVEFARESGKTRGGAPTLVPYEKGAKVRAQVFVLNTSVEDASDRLYRRETRKIGTGERYRHSDNPGPNKVVIKRLADFAGVDVVLYTEIGANIGDLSADRLAGLAIASVAKAEDGLDGISYLIGVIANGIETPLSGGYEAAIKRQLGPQDLAEALEVAKARAREAVDARGGFTGLALDIVTNYRWPKEGDRLLRADDDWQRAVSFEEQEVSRHAHIWDGYIKAGHALVEECERSNSRLDRHELVYPILFCYRHGLELAMKWIIGHYGRFAGVSADDHMHHNLERLWQACKEVILKVGSDGENEALLAVERIAMEFHALDGRSFSFRYSRDKKGMVISLPTVSFDLANIKDVMEGVNNLFTGADGQLDDNSKNIDWY